MSLQKFAKVTLSVRDEMGCLLLGNQTRRTSFIIKITQNNTVVKLNDSFISRTYTSRQTQTHACMHVNLD